LVVVVVEVTGPMVLVDSVVVVVVVVLVVGTNCMEGVVDYFDFIVG
jgi:hypothetical protein